MTLENVSVMENRPTSVGRVSILAVGRGSMTLENVSVMENQLTSLKTCRLWKTDLRPVGRGSMTLENVSVMENRPTSVGRGSMTLENVSVMENRPTSLKTCRLWKTDLRPVGRVSIRAVFQGSYIPPYSCICKITVGMTMAWADSTRGFASC